MKRLFVDTSAYYVLTDTRDENRKLTASSVYIREMGIKMNGWLYLLTCRPQGALHSGRG
jgi:hypothetical protein